MSEHPVCKHRTGAYHCLTLKKVDIDFFYSAFQSIDMKIARDNFLIKYTQPINVTRRRPKNNSKCPRKFQVKCFVNTVDSRLVPVCQQSFLRILNISRGRLQTVVTRYFETRAPPKDLRGGDRKSIHSLPMVIASSEFLKKIKCIEPHVCTVKSAIRGYIPSHHLNITRLYGRFIEENNENKRVTLSFFRFVFNYKVNLSFRSPLNDVCYTCRELKYKIRKARNATLKLPFLIEKRIHHLKFKAYLSLLKEIRNDLYTISFDCQKKQILPKLPDKSIIYSHHIYMNNLTVVENSLNSEEIFAYCWSEDEFPKDSNLISSVIYHRLLSINFNENVKTVRLVTGGCGDKYRKLNLLCMCSSWLLFNAPSHIEQIEIIFPVIGHSFLPLNSIFYDIDQFLKKEPVILHPDKYIDIYKKCSSVIRIGEDCFVFNWEQESKKYFKKPESCHFNYAKSKRLYIKRNDEGTDAYIRGECHYRNDQGCYEYLTLINSDLSMINPSVMQPNSVPINLYKLKSVNNLLIKHYGTNWQKKRGLSYFSDVISMHADEKVLDEKTDERAEVCCVPQEEEANVIV